MKVDKNTFVRELYTLKDAALNLGKTVFGKNL